MRKTVVTWVCDECGIESAPLRPGITFNWDFDSPKGWTAYRQLPEPCPSCGVVHDHSPYVGLGTDPALMPQHPPIYHFCCSEHREMWLSKRQQPLIERQS